MDSELVNHWFGNIRSLFPGHAEFRFPVSGAANLFVIDWKLNTDPARPNKRSKTINLYFSPEAVDDYLASADAKKGEADVRLQEFVAAQLTRFNPDHDTRVDQIPPAGTWIVTTEILNGA